MSPPNGRMVQMDPELLRGGQIGAGQIGAGQIGAGQIGAERLLDTPRSGA
jgi:hypothetical protein